VVVRRSLTGYEALDAHAGARGLALLIGAVDPAAGLVVGCVVEHHFLHTLAGRQCRSLVPHGGAKAIIWSTTTACLRVTISLT